MGKEGQETPTILGNALETLYTVWHYLHFSSIRQKIIASTDEKTEH